VEALELAEGLRVRGGGVQQLDAELSQPALEGDLVSEEPPGEAQVVVGEELAGEAVGGGRAGEAGPGGLPGRARAGEGAEQEAGMVVQAVDDPGLLAPCQLDLGGVDLPEVVGARALERLRALRRRGGLGATRWLRRRVWWMVEIAGGATPARRGSARILRAPQRGCRRRSSQISTSSAAVILAGELRGVRERGSSPASPSSSRRRR